MKKTLKPSHAPILVVGTVLLIAVFVTVVDTATGGGNEISEIFACSIIGLYFIYYLIKFLSGKRIEFDSDSFTVKNKTYRFSEISEAKITHKRVLRPSRRLRFRTVMRIQLYVRDECVLSFTDDEDGYKDFVAMLKKHRVKFNIQNSMSSWKGVIE